MSSDDLFNESVGDAVAENPSVLSESVDDAPPGDPSDSDESISVGSSFDFFSEEELSDFDFDSENESCDEEDDADSESEEAEDSHDEQGLFLSGPGPNVSLCGPPSTEKDPSKKTRRKRNTKTDLKRVKGQRRRNQSSTSCESRGGYMTDDYVHEVNTVLDPGLSEGESGLSCPSTLPSEADYSVDEGDGVQEHTDTKKEPTAKLKTMKKRKSKLGKIEKYSWRSKTLDDSISTSKAEGEAFEAANESSAGTANKPLGPDASTSTSTDRKEANLSPSSSSDRDFMSAIKNYLLFTLDDKWTMKSSGNTLCLCLITNVQKPVVEKAITWDITGKVNFLVHNQQAPPNSCLWQVKKADPKNAGKVADYLTCVSKQLDYFDICGGVQSNQHLWGLFSENASENALGNSSENATVDDYYSVPVLRSKSCHILRVYAGRCSNCHRLLKKMLDYERNKKKHLDGEYDETKINTRYMSKEDFIKKMKRIQNEKKLSQQQVRRLRSRIDKLLEKHSVQIENGMGEDFVKVLGENTDKMTAIEKLFWEQQSTALSKRKAAKTMRWHPTMIRLALHLRMLSPAAYDFMKGFISLPSQRRLFDYSQFADPKEGVQEVFLNQLSEVIDEKCPAEHQKYFNLLLDEMSIRSDLVYHARTGELIGFTNLTSLEEELASLEAEIQGDIYEKKLAKKVLVFMLTGATTNVKHVAAVYSTDNLTASQLYVRASDVIYSVEEAGAKVLTVICDGASTNRKFIEMHVNTGITKFVHKTENLAATEPRPLFFMLDPPHLLKTFRNCFANSYCHRNSRTLCINGYDISWKAIETLFEIIQKDKFKATKLTKAHVFLSSFSCMKVVLAVQIFSKAVARALQMFKDTPALKQYYNEELVNFILKMDRWFDCLNGSVISKKKAENPDLKEYTSQNDIRFDFLENEFLPFLNQWEDFVATRQGAYTKDQRSRMIISFQSLEGIRITVTSFIEVTKFLLAKGAPHVSARNFNQDPLEQYFSDQRRVRGADNNPTVKQVLHSRMAFHAVGQLTTGGKRGNTEDLRQIEVDSSPLPVKKSKME